MRLAFAMVALGIVIGLPASAKGQPWQEYRPEGIGFRIEKKEMIGASPARRILVEDADKDQFEFRIVIADNRLIQATFVGPAGNLLGRRFLDSLAILEPKQP